MLSVERDRDMLYIRACALTVEGEVLAEARRGADDGAGAGGHASFISVVR